MPQEFTDIISAEFRHLGESLGLQVDRFIRTSDPKHHETVRWLFELQQERLGLCGHVRRPALVFGQLACERRQVRRSLSDCGRPTETVQEENYFFRLSAFRSAL
jgi:methionyl-tRNA synthetase